MVNGFILLSGHPVSDVRWARNALCPLLGKKKERATRLLALDPKEKKKDCWNCLDRIVDPPPLAANIGSFYKNSSALCSICPLIRMKATFR
jgi:hypothetical protein